jgi:hypothetical protein
MIIETSIKIENAEEELTAGVINVEDKSSLGPR